MTLKSKARKKCARDQGKWGKWQEKGREREKFRRQSSKSRNVLTCIQILVGCLTDD